MAEHVVLVVGPMGAGKTTAIQTLSEIPVVSTEAVITERDVVDKPTTTVALDYGELSLGPDEKIRLYGIPGQKRFDFMWTILKERAVGMLVLVKNDAADPVGDLLSFLDDFDELNRPGAVIVGVTHSDAAPEPTPTDFQNAMATRSSGMPAPVFTVDPRNREHMVTLLSVLAASLDASAMFARESQSV